MLILPQLAMIAGQKIIVPFFPVRRRAVFLLREGLLVLRLVIFGKFGMGAIIGLRAMYTHHLKLANRGTFLFGFSQIFHVDEAAFTPDSLKIIRPQANGRPGLLFRSLLNRIRPLFWRQIMGCFTVHPSTICKLLSRHEPSIEVACQCAE